MELLWISSYSKDVISLSQRGLAWETTNTIDILSVPLVAEVAF